MTIDEARGPVPSGSYVAVYGFRAPTRIAPEEGVTTRVGVAEGLITSEQDEDFVFPAESVTVTFAVCVPVLPYEAVT